MDIIYSILFYKVKFQIFILITTVNSSGTTEKFVRVTKEDLYKNQHIVLILYAYIRCNQFTYTFN